MRIVNPYESAQELLAIEPHSIIAPFGIRGLTGQPRVITRLDKVHKIDEQECKLRTLDQLHTKLAIGNNGALLGSWNFSKANYERSKSPPSNIELVLKIEKDEPLFKDLQTYFESLWMTARPVGRLALMRVANLLKAGSKTNYSPQTRVSTRL